MPEAGPADEAAPPASGRPADRRTLARRAARAALAATVGGSLAVLLSYPHAPERRGARLEARPGSEAVPGDADSGAEATSEEAGRRAEAEALATRERLFAAVSRCRPSLTRAERARIAQAIQLEAERHGYDPLFVLAMIEVESTCSPTANGPRGAVGLIQIKPSTARAVAKDLGVPWQGRSTLVQPGLNVRLGLGYLAQLEAQFGDPFVAMAAYNLGPARVSGMPKKNARRSRYVKKILARYEGLLEEHA